MKCIKKIKNLILGRIACLQEKNAMVINKPKSGKTYILCVSNENPLSEKIIEINLQNTRHLHDGSFGDESEKNNYIVTPMKADGSVNVVPFIVALKSNKEIIPVYVSNDEEIFIVYGKPIQVSNCYTKDGQFDYEKINMYVDKWQSSITKSKNECEKVKKMS